MTALERRLVTELIAARDTIRALLNPESPNAHPNIEQRISAILLEVQEAEGWSEACAQQLRDEGIWEDNGCKWPNP